jgi:hypothetical protein
MQTTLGALREAVNLFVLMTTSTFGLKHSEAEYFRNDARFASWKEQRQSSARPGRSSRSAFHFEPKRPQSPRTNAAHQRWRSCAERPAPPKRGFDRIRV